MRHVLPLQSASVNGSVRFCSQPKRVLLNTCIQLGELASMSSELKLMKAGSPALTETTTVPPLVFFSSTFSVKVLATSTVGFPSENRTTMFCASGRSPRSCK